MRRLVPLALGAAAVTGCGGDDRTPRAAEIPRSTLTRDAPGPGPQRMQPVRRQAALVQRRTQLRDAPDGKTVQVLGRRTRFGSRQQVAVVARQGEWLGVLHPAVRGGRAGWIPAEAVRLVRVRYELAIDRSARVGRVRRDGKVIRRLRVAVGRPANPTPTGRYSVTDLIRPGAGSPYGWGILAITAHQGALPQGWGGGTRVALHGSPTDQVGGGVSAGCVRLRRRDLQWLFKRAAAGTRVEIVA